MSNTNENQTDSWEAVREEVVTFAEEELSELRVLLGRDWNAFHEGVRYWLDQIQYASTEGEWTDAADGLLQHVLETPVARDAFIEHLFTVRPALGRFVGANVYTLGGEEMAPRPKRALAPAEDEKARVVDTGFARQSDPDERLDKDVSLACDQPYYFWLEVGEPPPLEETMEEVLSSLPIPPSAAGPLPIRVLLLVDDREGGITVDAGEGELRLLPEGSVEVERQPLDLPSPLNDSDIAKRRLLFPVHTPEQAGIFQLRCLIYYEQLLLQSRVIHVLVMNEAQPFQDALRSVLDYSLTNTFQPEHLANLDSPNVSMSVNRNEDGTHVFCFVGKRPLGNPSFDAGEIEHLNDLARGVLREISWGVDDDWARDKGYRYRYQDGRLNEERLKKDLILLAIRGRRIYKSIEDGLEEASGKEPADLRDELRAPGPLQIALTKSARYPLPMALTYDYSLDPDKGSVTAYEACEDFLAALEEPAPLEESECFQGNCRHRADDAYVCPSGFWGYRHALGMPLSVGESEAVHPLIAYTLNPELVAGVSTDPDLEWQPTHRRDVLTLYEQTKVGDTRNNVVDMLRNTKPHLVYFYCHGGMSNNVPYIRVGAGPPTDPGIISEVTVSEQFAWKETRPLVFINGCHTAALQPSNAFDMVSAFVEEAGASGVIGTEITIFVPLAQAFAQEFLRRFLEGEQIGEAVRRARLALLKRGNPLALVYIPFVMANLCLKKVP